MRIIAQFKYQQKDPEKNSPQVIGFVGTVMQWNEKYILKLESSGFEQIYKFSESELPQPEPASAGGWEKLLANGDLGERIMENFKRMRAMFG